MAGSSGLIESYYNQFIKAYGDEVKPREGNNIRQVCPNCNNKSLSCNIFSGLVHCFHCSYGKGIRFVGSPSGNKEHDVDPEIHSKVTREIINSCDLTDSTRTYLISRGIYKPEDFQIKVAKARLDKILLNTFTEEELYKSGYFIPGDLGIVISRALQMGRILIPFWEGNEFSTLKSRQPQYVDETENNIRYIQPRGSNVKNRLFLKRRGLKDLIITEGELGVLSCFSAGFDAGGLAGVALAHNSSIVSKIQNLAKEYSRVFIIFDTDEDLYTDKEKLKCSVNLSDQISNSAICYLPANNQKIDIDEYLVKNPSEDLIELMEDAWYDRQSIYDDLRRKINENNRKV